MSGKLLDTTVLIDLSRGKTEAADFIDAARKREESLHVSVVSAMELIAGCRDKNEVEKARRLVSGFTLTQLTPAISAKAYDLVVTYSKSHNLSIPDSLIAATAVVQDLELATDNERHFGMIPSLRVSRPY